MHDSVIRLLNCARRAGEHVSPDPRVTDFPSLQVALGISSATLTNWKRRGVSKEGALAAETAFACSATWVLEGHGPHWKYSQTPHEGAAMAPLAQELSYPLDKVAPTQIAWEQLMNGPLEAEFQTVMPDASMAPDVPRGARIILVTGVEPAPGDFVLVADSQGNHYLREYKLLRPGHWEAHAINRAFLPLDSNQHQLLVLAVYDGIRGRRSGP